VACLKRCVLVTSKAFFMHKAIAVYQKNVATIFVVGMCQLKISDSLLI